MSPSSATLSCIKCRLRKVKCDKTLPACNRCKAASESCAYRERQQRERKAHRIPPTSSSKAETQDTLALIWERLRRIEEKSAKEASLIIAANTTGQQGSPHIVPTTFASPVDGTPGRSPWMDGSTSFRPLNPLHLSQGLHLDASGICSHPGDILKILNQAVEEAVAKKRRQLGASKEYILEDIAISPDNARSWLNNFFSENIPRFFPMIRDQALIDVKLLCLMPDLVQMKHVHIDASILVIYYCMLWHGHFEIDAPSHVLRRQDPLIPRNIYLACLRTVSVWQREAAGSVTDFVAATFMAQVASENLDSQLCWELHKRACTWSEALQLHSIDSEEGGSPSLIATTDGGRISMWNLVQIEMLFRLICDKPPAFSFDMSQWRVNLPFLFFDEDMDKQEAMPKTAFLAGSRVTLILSRFFQTLKDSASPGERLSSVNKLCEQVEETIQEWNIFEWHQSFKRESIDGWFLSELAVCCYSCIIFMLLRVADRSPDDELTPDLTDKATLGSEMSLRSCRRVLRIVCHMVQVIRLPGSQSLSIALGMYGVQTAYSILAARVLSEPAAPTTRDDLVLLKRFSGCIHDVASTADEYMALSSTLDLILGRLVAQVEQAV